MQSDATGQKLIKNKLKARERKKTLVMLRGRRCFDCKKLYEDYLFDFHHTNPKEKKFELGGQGLNRRWDAVLREFDKCVMLCGHCHRTRHYNERNETYETKAFN